MATRQAAQAAATVLDALNLTDPAATEDTLARKLRETQYAAEVEHQLSKDEILTRYVLTAMQEAAANAAPLGLRPQAQPALAFGATAGADPPD